MRKITVHMLQAYKVHLTNDEKAVATIEKYMRDIMHFSNQLEDKEITKSAVLAFKKELMENYSVTSVNSILSALNSFFCFLKWDDMKIKLVKVQKHAFANVEKELTKAEYYRLLSAAKSNQNQRLYLLMQSICSTGIRVSELKFITVQSVHTGMAEINNKGKNRIVFLPKLLCTALKKYISREKITSGSVFVSKSGRPLDRSNIWASMKKLCEKAQISSAKVFPHNLRHLFARTYYSVQKDIVRLSDILGHSSINTTRIYTQETGDIHRQQIQKLGLLRC